ncbi:hypothetical protein EDB84DRAFT_1443835 [Lactarius hengduanensis]|nr:hypothetical protein EDB84DRAFT_1443835 [Lactarius hengduanensis]
MPPGGGNYRNGSSKALYSLDGKPISWTKNVPTDDDHTIDDADKARHKWGTDRHTLAYNICSCAAHAHGRRKRPTAVSNDHCTSRAPSQESHQLEVSKAKSLRVGGSSVHESQTCFLAYENQHYTSPHISAYIRKEAMPSLLCFLSMTNSEDPHDDVLLEISVHHRPAPQSPNPWKWHSLRSVQTMVADKQNSSNSISQQPDFFWRKIMSDLNSDG